MGPWRRRLTWTQQDVVVEREDGTGSDVLRSARWWEPCCGCRWLSSLVTPLQSLRPPDAWTGRLATVGLGSSLGESDTRSSRAALSPRFSSAGLGCSPRPRLTETPAPRNRTVSDLWSLSSPQLSRYCCCTDHLPWGSPHSIRGNSCNPNNVFNLRIG